MGSLRSLRLNDPSVRVYVIRLDIARLQGTTLDTGGADKDVKRMSARQFDGIVGYHLFGCRLMFSADTS